MLRVCCAIIQYCDLVLVAQRNENTLLPLKWEFPGGKVELGESDVACIKREIQEELAMDIEVLYPLTPVHYQYDSFALELIPFVCRVDTDQLEKKEHGAVEWCTRSNLHDYDWAEADIPIVSEYVAQGNNNKVL